MNKNSITYGKPLITLMNTKYYDVWGNPLDFMISGHITGFSLGTDNNGNVNASIEIIV